MEKHYVVMWKDNSWGNFESRVFTNSHDAQQHIGRLHIMVYDEIRLYAVEPSMVYHRTPDRAIAS